MKVDSEIRRILVALDASPGSLAALRASAHVAALLKAELHGLFVEDEALLRGVELPLARVVGSFSGSLRNIDRKELEQTLRTQAGRARQALESIADQARVRWSFQVTRGAVTERLMAAAADADMVSLGRCGWSMIETRRMGTTTLAILRKSRFPVLLLPRQMKPGSAIVTLYEGTEKARPGLVLATRLARDDATPLIIVLHAADRARAADLKAAAETDLADLGVYRRASFRIISRMDAPTLTAAVQPEGIGILVFPAEAETPAATEFLSRLDAPVLIVR